MSLQEKVLKLKMDAAIALRHSMFWEKQIAEHGSEKATAFYTHLGLNHLEKKSYDWEGLTLSREPKDHEKLCIKGIHGAQESSKEQVTKVLLEARKELILAGLKGIKKLPAAQYHSLVLTVSPEIRQSLRNRLINVYQKGRSLVASELGGKKSEPQWRIDYREIDDKTAAILDERYRGTGKAEIKQDDVEEFDDLDLLTDLTSSRVSNDIAARIASAAARYTLLGLAGKLLWDAVEKEVGDGSTGWLDRVATGASNRTLNIGRSDEAEARKEEWQTIEFSSILDQNLCEECAALDGETATNEDDLEPVPLASCLGGDWCRCVHVYITI